MRMFSRLLLFIALFAGSFYVGKKWRSLEKQTTISSFQPTLYPVTNRSFAVVILGHNNGAFLEKTLDSVFSQNYLDFRIFYIDDASDDGSFELARDLIQESGQHMRVELLRNETRLGLSLNLSQVAESCSDHEIIVVVDGEDWLAHEWVLSRLNQYYANPDLWLTFGQYRQYPDYALGNSHPLSQTETIRQQPFFASHLKTFCAALFKRIDPDDLRFTADLAFMAPMLEMAQGHSVFIPEILYIENRIAANKEDTETVLHSEKTVRSKEPYSPLERIAL